MGILDVDQIGPDGSLLSDVDVKLKEAEKNQLLLAALPGSTAESYAGARVVRFGNHIILKAQVTHLGFPWPEFKKRIQIPQQWVEAHRQALNDKLTPHFVGIYRYGSVTIFVDFDPSTYVLRKANNSAAHVSTNDLFQAQTLGQFSRQDKNGNRLTSVRADQFATYLRAGYEEKNPHIEVFDRFSDAFLDGAKIDGLTAVKEMHAAGWPDKFQNEWAGFYLEFRLSSYLDEHHLRDFVVVQKEKRKGEFDYDLRFLTDGVLKYYGDLKASNIAVTDSPGNDAADFARCLSEYGRFWYVIFEHETWHGRDNEHLSTVAWNDWKRSVGFDNGKPYNELSYASRYKEAVRFVRVKILEVNQANMGIVLGDFQKNFRQPDGKPRKGKVMIRKQDIDNFLIYTKTITEPATTLSGELQPALTRQLRTGSPRVALDLGSIDKIAVWGEHRGFVAVWQVGLSPHGLGTGQISGGWKFTESDPRLGLVLAGSLPVSVGPDARSLHLLADRNAMTLSEFAALLNPDDGLGGGRPPTPVAGLDEPVASVLAVARWLATRIARSSEVST